MKSGSLCARFPKSGNDYSWHSGEMLEAKHLSDEQLDGTQMETSTSRLEFRCRCCRVERFLRGKRSEKFANLIKKQLQKLVINICLASRFSVESFFCDLHFDVYELFQFQIPATRSKIILSSFPKWKKFASFHVHEMGRKKNN